MTESQALVLEILSGQSEGYLCAPFASCFVAHSLYAEDVQADLIALADLGYAQFATVTETWDEKLPDTYDADTDTIVAGEVVPHETVVEVGWEITPAGRELLNG